MDCSFKQRKMPHAKQVAMRPVASARLFHLISNSFHMAERLYTRKSGAYSSVKPFLGAVEDQGRGSSHIQVLRPSTQMPLYKPTRTTPRVQQRLVHYSEPTVRSWTRNPRRTPPLTSKNPRLPIKCEARPSCSNKTVVQVCHDTLRLPLPQSPGAAPR